MGATPQYGSMIFRGASGKTYSIDCKISDVNGAMVTWDGGGGAGDSSPQFWVAPENVTLVDFSVVTGCADTEKIRLTANGRPTAHVLRYGIHVTTLATRPALTIGFTGGTQIGAIQISD